jgi:hypothetical protein
MANKSIRNGLKVKMNGENKIAENGAFSEKPKGNKRERGIYM